MTELVERIRELRGKITPGPWQWFKNVGTGYHIDTALGVESSSAYVIANHIVHEANAELISLAPEMADTIATLSKRIQHLEGAANGVLRELDGLGKAFVVLGRIDLRAAIQRDIADPLGKALGGAHV